MFTERLTGCRPPTWRRRRCPEPTRSGGWCGISPELLGCEQLWTSGPWPARFGLESDPDDTGYGHRPEQVACVRPDGAEVLIAYYEAVAARTSELLVGASAADLDRVVDERWDPPVTLGVRLVSIADDDIQHAGQAAYVRGILGR